MRRQAHRLHIAFDLDGTLIPECGEFPCERVGVLAEQVFSRQLRVGARALLRELVAGGHTLTIYTLSDRSALRLWLWLQLQGVPVKRVVTGRTHARHVPQKATKWPPTFGIDLLCDDSPEQVESARESGCQALLITNYERDWTAAIRARCLAPVPGAQLSSALS
jgi:hypothetical protein